jgi:hypothetical protein
MRDLFSDSLDEDIEKLKARGWKEVTTTTTTAGTFWEQPFTFFRFTLEEALRLLRRAEKEEQEA